MRVHLPLFGGGSGECVGGPGGPGGPGRLWERPCGPGGPLGGSWGLGRWVMAKSVQGSWSDVCF